MRSAPLLAQMPNPPTRAGIEGVRRRKMRRVAELQSAIRQSAVRDILGYWRAEGQADFQHGAQNARPRQR
eukprot:3555774-Alexandrium_andersonii.AAC.1